LMSVLAALKALNIFPRRYFYPALNTLPYVDYQICPVAEDIARRVICLPLFHELRKSDQITMSDAIVKEIRLRV
jgi:dTDP-4-amino-4,6-dideoxygalactose transaminase